MNDVQPRKMVRNTNQVASLATLGVGVQISKLTMEATGHVVCDYHADLRSMDGMHDTQQILAAWRDGSLRREHPEHLFVHGMRALLNREQVLAATRAPQDGMCQLVEDDFARGVWRYRLELGYELPARVGEVIETSDVDLVAGLGLLGCPVCIIEGTFPRVRYFVSIPPRDPGEPSPVEVAKLWYTDRTRAAQIPVFGHGMMCLYNRARLVEAVKNAKNYLLLQASDGSTRSAMIDVDTASDADWARVSRHLC